MLKRSIVDYIAKIVLGKNYEIVKIEKPIRRRKRKLIGFRVY